MKNIINSQVSKNNIMKNRMALSLAIALLLNGCATPLTAIPESLPPINEGTAQEVPPPLPSKSNYLDGFGAGIKSAMVTYEKTRHAPIFDTTLAKFYPYGEMTPTVTCSPLHTCDIALETSEHITGVYPGDTARWLFEVAESGDKSASVPHIVFKPKAANIETNAIVTTDKRTYHINLVSKDSVATIPISFYYPEDIENAYQELLDENKAKRKDALLTKINSTQKFNISTLDFNYQIDSRWNSSKPSLAPIHAFNDGEKVYLQMPEISKRVPLPALYITDNNQMQLVNFRVKSPYYIVDRLFQKAVMVNGTGQNAESITISHE